MIYPIFLCALAGIVGAWASEKSFAGQSVLWPFSAGLLSLLVWSWMTKQNMKPWIAATIFTGAYESAWFVALWCMGERPTVLQIVGVAFVLVGLLIANVSG